MKTEKDITKEAINDAGLYMNLAEEHAKEENYKIYFGALLSCYKTIYSIAKQIDKNYSKDYLRFLCNNKSMGLLTYREIAEVLQIDVSEIYSVIIGEEA